MEEEEKEAIEVMGRKNVSDDAIDNIFSKGEVIGLLSFSLPFFTNIGEKSFDVSCCCCLGDDVRGRSLNGVIFLFQSFEQILLCKLNGSGSNCARGTPPPLLP